MEQHKSISNLFSIFTDIINTLNGFDKTYTNNEPICDVLKCLLKAWKAKITIIQEAKDLSKLSIEKLIGSPITYELNMLRNKEEDKSKEKRIMAFKSTTKVEENDESEDVDEEESENKDEDLGQLTRKFKFLVKKG